MPTYQYECRNCGYSFEAVQHMSDPPLSICPQCGKEIRRVINGGIGVIFKGPGFYVTDNAKSSSMITGHKHSEPKADVKSVPKQAGSSPAKQKAAS
jgi:putative FmdB family regulatory protein